MSLENVNAMTILSEGPVEADPISVDAYYIDLAGDSCAGFAGKGFGVLATRRRYP